MNVDIDLHLHTKYSDGSETPRELVARAHELGLKTIAETDHDGIDGVQQAVEAGAELGIRVIPGIEFSTKWTGSRGGQATESYDIHMLGYGIDLQSDVLKQKMAQMLARRDSRNERMRKAFHKTGINISQRELEDESGSGFVGKRSFANVLVQKGYAASIDEAFASERFMAHPGIRSIHKEKTDAAEAIRIIREAGGKSFFAHPFQMEYATFPDQPSRIEQELRFVVSQLAAFGLDGLECYYPTHDQSMTDFLLNLADENGLLASIGSDDHGPGARKVKRIHGFGVDIDLERLRWVETL